jgi:8-oxo-dGTP pyrophosphatase MutT (NUDIX family)
VSPHGFTKVAEVELVRAKVFRVVRSTFRGPDGDEFERHIVHHPGAVAVVPLHDDGTVSLVRQYRPALERELLELPAGTRDVHEEDARVTAERELVEEAGLAADRLEHLVTFNNAPGMSDEVISVFLATGLRDVEHDRQSVEEHAMTVERLGLDDALALIDTGELMDAKTIIGLTAVAARLR